MAGGPLPRECSEAAKCNLRDARRSRAQTQSQSDLRREDATPEEVAFLLNTTALDAFDRYWANPKTSAALNADLAAYGKAKPKN